MIEECILSNPLFYGVGDEPDSEDWTMRVLFELELGSGLLIT